MDERPPDPAANTNVAKVRHAVKVITPSGGPVKGSVTVLERQSDVLLIMEAGSIERELPMTLAEARALRDGITHICRRIVSRPEWKP